MARNRYDVDESLDVKFNKEQFKRLFKYVKPYKKEVVTCGAWMVVASCLSLLTPYFTQLALDEAIPNKDMKALVILGLLLAGATIISTYIMRNRILTMGRVGQDIILDLRKDLFEHLQELPFTYYDTRPHGKILTRVVNYVNSLSDLLTNGFINLIADTVTLLIAVGFMLVLDVRLTFVALGVLPVLTLIVFSVKKRQRIAYQNLLNKQSNMNAYIHESISGIKVTQAFAREDKNKADFNEVCSDYRKGWYKMVYMNQLMWPSVDITSITSMALIYIVGVLAFEESVSIGVIVAFAGYVGRFWGPVMNMSNIYNNVLNAMSSIERIFEMLDEKPVVHDKENAVPMKRIVGDVAFEDVTFMYEEGDPILREMSFEVKRGDSIAIVGPTGSGKTTIVNLLSRFYNLNGGRILVDGQDISEVTLHSLRKQMGVMLQDAFIFSGTIMDNIRYGKLEATDEEVIAAAKVVRAHEFITSFPEGYQTEVNERGSRLSVGQRQLIAFARVLLADPKILVLDEATSSIDTQTEKQLQEGLDELLKGRTSFIIAHRLSTIQNANQIFYINDGKIQERGTHEQLMALEGYYYELQMAQQQEG